MTWIRTAAHRACTPAIFLIIPLLALAGCGHKDTLVGKWQGTTTTQQGNPINTTIEYTPDGKENFGIQGGTGAMTITLNGAGTYTVSGSSLTQNITSLTINGRPIPANQARPQTGPFTVDGDHLTMTNPSLNKSMTLTRVKE